MQSAPEHLGCSSLMLQASCTPRALPKRISNGEVIEQLQCLGGDRLAPTPVLQVGDAMEEDNKEGSEGFARLPLFAVRRILPGKKSPNISSSTLHRNHRHHKPQNIGIKSLYLHLVD